MTDEHAKAIQELAKAAGKGIDATRGLGSFFAMVFGGAAEEAGGLLQDWIVYRRELSNLRWERLTRLAHRTEELCKARSAGEVTRPIPAKLALQILDEASLEEDDFLQDMWAQLLATALDPEAPNVHRSFARILPEFEPIDAKILMFLAQQKWGLFMGDDAPGVSLKKLSEEMGLPENEGKVSLVNLFRLGCVVDHKNETWDTIDVSYAGIRVEDSGVAFRPSRLGYELLKACGANID